MRDLMGVAEQLRNVRLAQRQFLGLWAMEQTVILPALDRVAADMKEAAHFPPPWDSSGTAKGNSKSPLDD
jgi:hypothetical protein